MVSGHALTLPSASQGELDFAVLHGVLSRTSLRTPILWSCGLDGTAEAILDAIDPGQGARDAETSYYLGMLAMADRDYARAANLLAESRRAKPDERLIQTHVYLLCMAQRFDEARRLVAENDAWIQGPGGKAFLAWLSRAVGFERHGS